VLDLSRSHHAHSTPSTLPSGDGQSKHSVQVTAGLDWNSRQPQGAATLARNPYNTQCTATRASTVYEPKTTDTLTQSGSVAAPIGQNFNANAVRTTSSRLEQPDSQLWSEVFSSDANKRSHLTSTSAQPRFQQPTSPLSRGLFSPVNHEQKSPVVARNPEQRSFDKQTVALVRMASDDMSAPRGLVNGGNLCFVSCVLQSLGVVTELVAALRHSKSTRTTSENTEHRLVSCLSDVLSALHSRQSTQPINPRSFLTVMGGLMTCRMIDVSHQSQHDAAEFLSALLQLLQPRLITAVNGQYTLQRSRCMVIGHYSN